MREVSPIFSSSTECFPVADIWVIGLDPLNLLLYELVVCRRYSLPLLGRSIRNPSLTCVCDRRSYSHLVGAFGWWTEITPAIGGSIDWCLDGLQWLEGRCHIDWPQICAVPASDGHNVIQAAGWYTHRKNYVAKIARYVAKLLRWRRNINTARHVCRVLWELSVSLCLQDGFCVTTTSTCA